MTEPVRYAVEDGVATITLDRPESMNSLDTATKVALRDHVERAATSSDVRAVVLTGTGRAFCVGQDLGEHAEALNRGDADLGQTVHEHYNPTVRALVTMPKPVIAAVNGIAAGAGASYAFACDLRILADSAGFNLAFTGIGLSCDTGSSWTLPRLVGWAKARELLLLPRTVDAAEAERIGLATEVVAADDVLDRALVLARQLADGPTRAYGAIRHALDYAAVHSFEDALATEAEMMQLTGNTQDHRDAVEAFLAKQKPTFHGR
ncbi:enoyl-CoA hydratase [Actinobacteria bacterium YIM 96077]|uniref:Enoyl-CoA hydratase n=1 Tax=Phytoactinopolyspora halophila TaxID=1981511 RepID=A0A329QR60_9ACTN|nr:enoyl-CoA hydratase-related protein [Phytoactinopolyspora halophila]AYY14302.1 enoyl-CoA hydratase [Actinobacteria bacterium YIM 96077]RAW14844.1 enoyl-CoA hydratase [Phytoactinopolyspora halophila]